VFDVSGGSDAAGGTATTSGTRTAGDTGTSATRAEVSDALREIRREGHKIAVIYGVVDAALATLLANLLLHLVGPAWTDGTLPVASVELPRSILVAVAIGLFVFGGEAVLRSRRPIVEQFEAANPSIREMLRTARDAVAGGRDSRMARVLYADVLDSLRQTSSFGLVDRRRLSVTLVVVLVLSVVSIQAVVLDLDLGGNDPSSAGGEADTSYDGLRDGSEVLGKAENVSAGDNDLDAQISGSGEGDAPPGGAPSSYDSGGIPSGEVESQQAGFSATERLEESELIRDYNLKLRNETNV
jgi:hypothetical protein